MGSKLTNLPLPASVQRNGDTASQTNREGSVLGNAGIEHHDRAAGTGDDLAVVATAFAVVARVRKETLMKLAGAENRKAQHAHPENPLIRIVHGDWLAPNFS